MKSYRIHLVGRDGRLQLGDAFEAAGDSAAVERAVGVAATGGTVELWEGGRIVGRVSRKGVFTPGA